MFSYTQATNAVGENKLQENKDPKKSNTQKKD